MTERAATNPAPRSRAGRKPPTQGWRLAAWMLLAVLLPAPVGLASTPPADAGADAGSKSEADGDVAAPSPEEVLATLRQQLDGMDQGIKTLQEQMELNREEIAGQSERLDTEMKRMDPIALRLDSLAKQQEQAQDLLEEHEARIEDNSVKL